MLSIVLPTYNAPDYLEQTVKSIFETTASDFELIVIDNASTDPKVRPFLEGLSSPQVEITKIFNTENYWVNYSWNLGAKLAKGEYVAILNSDIILSKNWDLPLIKLLQDCTIACPLELKSNDEKTFLQELHPLVAEIDPKMINGACFMFKKEDVSKLFPIPSQIKHWCGDNWLADHANDVRGVKFASPQDKSTIKHFVTRSGATLDPFKYKTRILRDVEEYERVSDRNMKKLKERINA